MANKHGDFIWYELMTSDVDAAAEFYGAVVGWTSQPFGGSDSGYNLLRTAKSDVAGLMAIPADAAQGGMTPGWYGYVGVDDVDAAVAAVVEAGGTSCMPATDIPGVGRLAMLADPQGALFYVMRGSMDGTSTSFAPDKAGHCRWNELATSNPEAAIAFYRDRFGWEKGDAMPMGEMGEYRFLTHHGETFGAVTRRSEGGPPVMWSFYFGVEDIDVATKAATERGAPIHFGPEIVPTGDFIIIASDPQGALFGLVGPRRT